MPILHTQYETEVQQPDGSVIAGDPQHALVAQGPCVQIIFGLAASLATQIIQQGHPVPNPVSGMGLIDTGASTTCIDNSTAQAMGLPVVDVVKMMSASHAATDANVYPIQLQLIGTPIRVEITRALGAELKGQGIIALIGRDFLANCTLFYNGVTGGLTLST
ncbi:MAG: retroviral-like aspartic protease family protein [Acidobacteria bacterium]|nr:retroviral-like aspartic protease family protein [Acidobacteriota bacterium]MBV9068210.1 retroviral-like aspartic protease family protein [Acidobacteriota bacterium]MBV9185513.1 retroviral-like aspartic protease family protein [Acidobacteriota bacterium]